MKKEYLQEAKNFQMEKFHNADGWDYASGELLNADSGVMAHKYNVDTSQPYVVRVDNTNLVATTAFVLGAYTARTAANFNNPAGVNITSGMPNVTYAEFLAQMEHKNFKAGMIYIQAISGSNAVITATLSLTTKDADGNAVTGSLLPKKDPNQQQTDVLEYYHMFNVNGFTSWTVSIPASTIVEYTIYPVTTVDDGRALINPANVVRSYGAPKIGKSVSLNLSPSAIAALGKAE